MFLEISQNSQENTCASLFFNKVAGIRAAGLLKKRLWHRCFPVNFEKFLGTPFFKEHLCFFIKWLQENFFFIHSLDNKFLYYKMLHKPWLGFLAAYLFLNGISAPSSLDLQIGIVSTVRNRLSENRCEMWNLRCLS